ncbi:MAG: hypothetical protein OXH67_13665 [Acidimicrobiaceae bacterium]|nr:hypothetical protein [Acidimicrobiaceae bacterium]
MDKTIPATDELRRQFAALDKKVFAHVGDNARGAQLAVHADGAVFHGSAGFAEARRHKGKMLYGIDLELYATDRFPQTERLFEESERDAINAQIESGAAFLIAPSRFPSSARDTASIKSLLKEGRRFVAAAQEDNPPLPAVVPIVVRFDELEDRRWVAPVQGSGLPIATVFAAYGDPLSTPAQLEGAIELIQAASVACVLRCDTSAIGLMAVGAVAGAIGTSSAVRHLWLPSRRSDKRSSVPRIFVPRFANWMKEPFIQLAAADPRLDDLFRCDCSVCGHEGDVRALTHPSVKPQRQDEHSIAAAVKLAHRVLRAKDPEMEWVKTCNEALNAYDKLDRVGIEGPAKPGALEAWISVLGSVPAPATSQMPSLR